MVFPFFSFPSVYCQTSSRPGPFSLYVLASPIFSFLISTTQSKSSHSYCHSWLNLALHYFLFYHRSVCHSCDFSLECIQWFTSAAVSLQSSLCDKTAEENDGQRVNYTLYELVRELQQKHFIWIQFTLRQIGERNRTFASPLIVTKFRGHFCLPFCYRQVEYLKSVCLSLISSFFFHRSV